MPSPRPDAADPPRTRTAGPEPPRRALPGSRPGGGRRDARSAPLGRRVPAGKRGRPSPRPCAGAGAAAAPNRRRRTCFGGLGLGPCPGPPGPLGADAPRAHTASPSGYPPCAPLAPSPPRSPARGGPLPFLRPTPAGSRGPRALTRAAASQPSSDKPSARGLRLFSCSRPASALVATAAPKKDPRPTEPPSARVGRADPCLPASQKRPHPDLLLTLSPGA